MKAKINIELWDNSPASNLEEIGLTVKFLELCYKAGYEQYTKDLCKDAPELNYVVSVEIEDNTIN